MSFLKTNLLIISQRWPDIHQQIMLLDMSMVDAQWVSGQCNTIVFQGIQQGSNYDALLEAEIQCQQIPENAANIQVYGIGLGHVQALLLARSKVKKLTTTILNLHLLTFSLIHIDHGSWLNDLRTDLQVAKANQLVAFPFVALPGELATIEEASAALRDRICLELDQQFIADKHSSNFESMHNAINVNSALIQADKDVKALALLPALQARLLSSATFVVAAAGPTLSDHYEWLKKQAENIIIIAVDAAVKPLLKAKIKPDIIVSIDPVADRLFNGIAPESLTKVPLVYFPLLKNDFLKSWPGARFVSFSIGKSFDDMTNGFNKTRLYSAGSVIHPSIDLAVKLAAEKILLLGADFSLIRQQTHVEETNVLSERPLLSPDKTPHWVHNGYGEKVPTYLNFRGYLRDLESYISLHPEIEFYNGSFAGAAIKGTKLWPEFFDENANKVSIDDK